MGKAAKTLKNPLAAAAQLRTQLGEPMTLFQILVGGTLSPERFPQ